MADTGRTIFGGSGLSILEFPDDYCYVYADGGEVTGFGPQ